MKLLLALATFVVLTSQAVAAPALETWSENGYSMQVPKGWTVAVDWQQGTWTVAQDPSRQDAAILFVMVQVVPDGFTEDVLLDAASAQFARNLKAVRRGALPGGSGRLLVAEGVVAGISVRLGVVAVVANNGAMIGALVSKKGDFDRLGGTNLAVTVLGSLRAEGQTRTPAPTTTPTTTGSRWDETIEELAREEKRTDRSELDPDRAAVAKTAIVGTWGRGTVMSIPVEEYRDSTSIYGHYDSNGEGEIFTLGKDRTYRIVTLTQVRSGACHSKAVEVERGTYAFDGRRLVLTVKGAEGTYSVCGSKPKKQPAKSIPKPRAYDATISADGRLVLVGPSCGAFAGSDCKPRARWEMKPSN
jgi:hypothetical protein